MLGFAATGITLNHAGQIGADPRVTQRTAELPGPLRASLSAAAPTDRAPLPPALREWLRATLDIRVGGRRADWYDDEIYLDLPRPGGDAWLALDLVDGVVEYERTDRGWVSYLNDLHKGRNTGAVWGWFLDAFAVACLVFCVTGLLLLQVHGSRRAATWPLVGLGLVVPMLVAVLFIH